MGAAIVGLLSALGNLGEQKAEAADYNTQQRLRNEFAAAQMGLAQKEASTRDAESYLRRQIETQRLQAGAVPALVGSPYIGADGKQYGRFQDPLSGVVTTREITGPLPETQPQAEYRGLTQIGVTPGEASGAILSHLKGRSAEKREVIPDATSATGYSAVYYDTDGNEVWRTATDPPRFLTPTQLSGWSRDIYGNWTYHSSYRQPVLPGSAGAAPPRSAPGGPGGPTPPPNPQTPQGGPSAPQGGPKILTSSSATPPPAGSQAGPAAIPGKTGTVSGKPGTLNVGTYQGLDDKGHIPQRPGLNEAVVEFANDLMDGRDIQQIPQRARGPAEALARRYGWKGQGSLSPKEQLQIQEADSVIQKLMNPQLLKTLDGGWDTYAMRALPMDVKEDWGVMKREGYATAKSSLSPAGQTYFDLLNQLRSLMGGFRKFTGGNASEGQIERYLSELPAPATTPDSKDAVRKLGLLHNELQVAMRYGYFPRGEGQQGGAPAAGTPSPSNPAGLDLPQ